MWNVVNVNIIKRIIASVNVWNFLTGRLAMIASM